MVTPMPFASAVISPDLRNTRLYYESKTIKTIYLPVRKTTDTTATEKATEESYFQP